MLLKLVNARRKIAVLFNQATVVRNLERPLPAVPDYWMEVILTKFETENNELNSTVLQTMSLNHERDNAAAFDRNGAIHDAVAEQAAWTYGSLCEETSRDWRPGTGLFSNVRLRVYRIRPNRHPAQVRLRDREERNGVS